MDYWASDLCQSASSLAKNLSSFVTAENKRRQEQHEIFLRKVEESEMLGEDE